MALNSGWAYTEQVGIENAGQTVLAHLAASRLHSTVQDWAERIDRGEVELDDARAAAGAVLRPGQTLVWHRPPWDEPDVPLRFEMLHEDGAIVAVIKPSGLPTMPAGGFLEHTLFALVRAKYPEAAPLHRLGRFTSGIVIFARTPESAAALGDQWRNQRVRKIYRALGSGVAVTDRFAINTPIGPVAHARLGFIHAASANGRPAHTICTVLERRADTTLFSVEITTGRPHQDRKSTRLNSSHIQKSRMPSSA